MIAVESGRAADFVSKIRWATAPGRFDVSTDGFQPYETAIDAGLYDRANHSQVVKMFSNSMQRFPESYGPAKFVAVAKDVVNGDPDLDRAGTSHVERKNGTQRQWCKRLKIDSVLGQHYGLSPIEVDSIINYDIKYRMGQDDAHEADSE